MLYRKKWCTQSSWPWLEEELVTGRDHQWSSRKASGIQRWWPAERRSSTPRSTTPRSAGIMPNVGWIYRPPSSSPCRISVSKRPCEKRPSCEESIQDNVPYCTILYWYSLGTCVLCDTTRTILMDPPPHSSSWCANLLLQHSDFFVYIYYYSYI